MRKSRVLLHISSLPSKHGIGTFGKEAYRFVDFLEKANQRLWQILPLGPTSYGDSPYQTFSAFANNPYFIDLDFLVKEKLLTLSEIKPLIREVGNINYEELYNTRFIVLKKAFRRFLPNDAYVKFLEDQKLWLHDYALFMTLKFMHEGKAWSEWHDHYRLRDVDALSKLETEQTEEINFWKFVQFKAFEQWRNLKKYANDRSIEIIGDMPIYVAFDSSDAWANPNLFEFDHDRKPVLVAGVPPDNFSADGQLWGNPIYNWKYMKEQNYQWWVERVRAQSNDFDIIRIDHFIGFVNYFAIPYGEKTAKNGNWLKGPGIELFDAIKAQLGQKNIIAEDLGVVTDEVRAVIKQTGFPSMKLTQFAFDPSESSDYLPYNYEKNTIVYTGTHDNETTKTWFEKLDKNALRFCLEFINDPKGKNKIESFIKMTLSSVSNLCVIPMQDYLELGSEGRMNTPSTVGSNWQFRINQKDVHAKLANRIKKLSKTYGRNL